MNHFTEGPWQEKLRLGAVATRQIKSGNVLIAEVYESLPNAILIKSCPDIYEALKNLVEMHEEMGHDWRVVTEGRNAINLADGK